MDDALAELTLTDHEGRERRLEEEVQARALTLLSPFRGFW